MPSFDNNSSSEGKGAPCRTCTDFKSWAKNAKKQNATFGSSGDETTGRNSETPNTSTVNSNDTTNRHGCPYDKDDLGRSTWGLLHTMAANYPEIPSKEEISNVSAFFSIFAKVYPCDMCAKDFQMELIKEPVEATSQHSLSQWLCRMHNKVNNKLGKPLFDCRLVNERWRDGWKDGSCD
ncbi:FAD-linked sulfhydryl oxidase ALR [Pseudolycoriella hygida]|uniref:Sulfhydryl oxidase n=1 Tax=Pseudolycoriella hygida TaxID=35572 RepID=A0A9Q0MX80_9DIPT|nr:FAD-linked sulfhydryl oxidase ALR [Pseudolycoriella hygida]